MAQLDRIDFKGRAWTTRRTQAGDKLSTLSREYGVPACDIVEANGIPWEGAESYVIARLQELGLYGEAQAQGLNLSAMQKAVREHDINEWVRSIGGNCLPGPARGRANGLGPLIGCETGGWATFTSDTSIMLPDTQRNPLATAPRPCAETTLHARAAGGPPWALLGGLGVVAALAYVASRKRRK